MLEVLLIAMVMGLTLASAVGPAFFALIGLSFSKGMSSGFRFAIGVTLSDVVIIILLYFLADLIKPFFESNETLLFGGFFLLLYGALGLLIKVKKKKPKELTGNEFVGGFTLNIVNPNCYLLWLGFIAACPLYKYLWLYLMIILVVNFSVDILKVYTAALLKNKIGRGNNYQLLNRIIPIAFLCTGLVILINYCIQM